MPGTERYAFVLRCSQYAAAVSWVAAILLGSVFIVSGLIIGFLSRHAARGNVSRNRLLGLRTSATLGSDDAWAAGQIAFAPYGTAAGIGAAIAGIALLSRPGEITALTIVALASIWISLVPIVGAIVGHRAAKRADR